MQTQLIGFFGIQLLLLINCSLCFGAKLNVPVQHEGECFYINHWFYGAYAKNIIRSIAHQQALYNFHQKSRMKSKI